MVEGSLTVALVAFGGGEAPTVAAVLLYRLISFWLPLPVGGLCYLGLLRARRRATPSSAAAGSAGTDAAGADPVAADNVATDLGGADVAGGGEEGQQDVTGRTEGEMR